LAFFSNTNVTITFLEKNSCCWSEKTPIFLLKFSAKISFKNHNICPGSPIDHNFQVASLTGLALFIESTELSKLIFGNGFKNCTLADRYSQNSNILKN
jgi:hypothetical protein